MSSKLSNRYRPRVDLNRHTNLVTQQRRLRHLTCIVGRNIDSNLIPATRQASKCSLLSLYYTIHNTDNDIVLYQSETIHDTLNPNWKEFDSNVFSKHPSYTRDSSIKVCVWGAKLKKNFQMILCYQVYFSGLVYKKDQLRSIVGGYESNCLLFRLFNGYYAMLSTFNATENILHNHIKTCKDQVCLSYKKASLLRVNDTVKAINQTRQQVHHVRLQMQLYLNSYDSKRKKRQKVEALKFQNNLLKEEVTLLKQRLQTDSEINMSQKGALKAKESDLQDCHDNLEQYISDMKVCHSAHISRREELLKVNAHLSFRRRQLAAELSYIYPIIELSPAKNDHTKREYSICGVKLPNSEDFLGEDEAMLAVAIGNVAHLVYMMAKFLELPLRYPLWSMGSRSTVVDYVTDKLTDKEREFPLYSKGKEKFQFNYGVFLLNKNIAQLRYHNGLGTADLRNTLSNLKQLLEVKYGVRIVMRSDNNLAAISRRIFASRSVSLPVTSSPTNLSPPDKIFDLNQDRLLLPTSKDRPRSQVISSGLPSVHVKKQKQHRFLSRKSSNKKLLNVTQDPDDISPDLISVPFEDLIQKTIEGELHTSDKKQTPSFNSSLIDLGEDSMSNVKPHGCNKGVSDRSFNQQFNDDLIIPDPPLLCTEDLLV